MPYRRRPYRRRRFGRYSKRRIIKGYLRKKVKKGNVTVVKLRAAMTVTTNVAGIIDRVFYNSRPDNYDGDGNPLQDWSNYAGVYDSYRVCAIKVKYIPSFPNDTSTVTGFFPMYVVHDVDDVTPIASANTAIQYENMKIKNMYRPWSVYYRIPKYTSMATAGTMVAPGYIDVAYPKDAGSVKLYCSGLDVSTDYGRFIATYYCAFKNRR